MERTKSHLAGSLGQWILNDAIVRRWAHQDLDSRAIQFSSHGLRSFYKNMVFQIKFMPDDYSTDGFYDKNTSISSICNRHFLVPCDFSNISQKLSSSFTLVAWLSIPIARFIYWSFSMSCCENIWQILLPDHSKQNVVHFLLRSSVSVRHKSRKESISSSVILTLLSKICFKDKAACLSAVPDAVTWIIFFVHLYNQHFELIRL